MGIGIGIQNHVWHSSAASLQENDLEDLRKTMEKQTKDCRMATKKLSFEVWFSSGFRKKTRLNGGSIRSFFRDP